MAAFRFAPILALLLALPAIRAEEPKKKPCLFRTGPTTTFVDGPVDADGYIDYEAAANAFAKGKIVPQANAVVALMRCIGPKPEGSKHDPDFYRYLETDSPPDEGPYFGTHYKHFPRGLPPQAAKAFETLEAELRRKPWLPADAPDHADWLALNEMPLARAAEATLRAEYFYPCVGYKPKGVRWGLVSSRLSAVQLFREVAAAMEFRVTLRLGQGRPDDALADALVMHRLGRLVARGQCQVEMLVGLFIDRLAFRAGLAILEHGKLTAKQLQGYGEELARLPAMPPLAAKFRGIERMVMLEATQVAHKEGLHAVQKYFDVKAPGTPLENHARFVAAVDWEAVLGHMNADYDRAEVALGRPTYAERQTAWAAWTAEAAKRKERATADKDCEEEIAARPAADAVKVQAKSSLRVAEAILAQFSPFMDKVVNAYDLSAQVERNARIAVALAAHKADAGSYPEALADLAPRFIPALPTDLYTGKPMTYRTTKAGYLLYSVGPNGTDDGGKLTTDDPPGDDVGIRVGK